MQDNVDIYTKALIRAIHDSREFREYENIKKKLQDMPELKKRINRYRIDVYKLQNTGDGENLYDRVEEFNRVHAEFRRDPLVDEYLKCELAVCRMLQRVATRVVGTVDLELDDIAGEIRS
ncbi:MAG: YlbF family regulator [Eubacteriales bacterium]|nr:YlbF family regulator [Eubacteriales bacterium]